MNYEHGLSEVSDGCFAYLQPDGGWGWSNAGLVVGDGASLLVDTLFDLELTVSMLRAMDDVTTGSPIATVVNTHANGDHCYGNQLLGDAEIVATEAAADEMAEVPPSTMAALCAMDGEIGDLFRHFFGAFSFEGIEQRLPTRTFTGRLDLDVGGRSLELVEVGPAHTRGDLLVFAHDSRTVFTGDILFIGGTPIVWAGPLSNWIAACDLIASSDVDTVVPGHGPVTDKAGVVEVRDYLSWLQHEAAGRHGAGMDAWDAARDIASMLGRTNYANWGEFGRVAVNVDAVYRDLDAGHSSPNVVEQFRRMLSIESAGGRP